MHDLINIAGSVLLTAAAAIATTSVIVHLRVRWWASQMGHHLLFYMLTVALVLDLGAIRFVFSGAGVLWFELLRLAVFALVPLVLGQRLYLQLQARREARAAHAAPDPAAQPEPGGPT